MLSPIPQGPLPSGWEERETSSGRPYYVCHHTRVSQVSEFIQGVEAQMWHSMQMVCGLSKRTSGRFQPALGFRDEVPRRAILLFEYPPPPPKSFNSCEAVVMRFLFSVVVSELVNKIRRKS